MIHDHLGTFPSAKDPAAVEMYDRLLKFFNDMVQSGAYKNTRNCRTYVTRAVIDGKDVVRAHDSVIFPLFLADIPSDLIMEVTKKRQTTDQSFKVEYDPIGGWLTYQL